MICIRCGCETKLYNRRDNICDPCRENMALADADHEKARRFIQSQLDELRRFREREPLVQAFLIALWSCPNDDALDEMCTDCHRLVASVRDFGLCTAGAPTDAAITASTTPDEHGADAESLNNPTR